MKRLLDRLLASLERQTRPITELIVVDNGSTDGAADLARERGARVISMGQNAGFAAAVNRGIREAQCDWVAVLNSDVELAPDYIERLVATDAWFATGKLLTPSTDRVDGTFDAICRGGTSWRVGSGRKDGPIFSERYPSPEIRGGRGWSLRKPQRITKRPHGYRGFEDSAPATLPINKSSTGSGICRN